MNKRLVIGFAVVLGAVAYSAVSRADRAAPAKALRLVDVIDALDGGKAREIFIEGPAVDEHGVVFFTDEAHKPESRILRYDTAKQELSVFKEKAGRANGMTFDRQGRLIACEGSREPGGNRRVVRYEKDGTVTVLADKYDGKKLNSPNDAVVDALDRVWFTDPRYVGNRADLEQDCEAVYRIDSPGTDKATVVRVLGKGEVVRPNGIALSPDGKTLYVADSPAEAAAQRLLLAYDIAADGSLKNRRVVYDFKEERGIDGMRVDRHGVIYGTAGSKETSGIIVISPDVNPRRKAWWVPLPETPGNCAWGGPDGGTLFITASRGLYAWRSGTVGYAVYPAKWPQEK